MTDMSDTRRSFTPDYPYRCPAPYCGIGFHTESRRDQHFDLIHASPPAREPLPEAVRRRLLPNRMEQDK